MITGTPRNDHVGDHAVSIDATDTNGAQTTQSLNISVTNTNDAPVLTDPGTQSDAEGDDVSLQLVGSDPDGQAFTWAASGLPAGLAIDTNSGLISGTLNFDAAGSHTVTVSISDGSLVANTSFTWTVANTNRAPVFTSSPITDANEDTAYTYIVTTNDIDGDVVTLQASTLPTWLTFDPSTGVITGTPRNDHVGDHAVSIDATDTNGDQATQSFVLTITPVDNLVPGDANQDGVVDIADLGIVGANFNNTSVEWSQGDFNGDAKVDIADLGIIGANWTAADSAVALYAASEPRGASLHMTHGSIRLTSLDLSELLQLNSQSDLICMLEIHREFIRL